MTRTTNPCAHALVRLALVHLMQHVPWQTAETGETAIIPSIVVAVEQDAGHVMEESQFRGHCHVCRCRKQTTYQSSLMNR